MGSTAVEESTREEWSTSAEATSSSPVNLSIKRAVNPLLRHLEAFDIELAHEPSPPEHDTAPPKHRDNDSPTGQGHTRQAV